MTGLTSWIAASGLALGLFGAEPAESDAPDESADGPSEPAEPTEPEPPTEPELGPAERAQQHFAAEEWDEAIDALMEAYADDPQPAYLYARAQAERMRGNCRPAIALYQRFLASGTTEQQRIDTDRHIRLCEEILFNEQVAAGPEPEIITAPLTKNPTEPASLEEPEEPRERRGDPLGTTLIIGGSGLVVLGTVFLSLGARDREQSQFAFVEQEFEQLQTQARRRTIAGLSLASAGVSVALGGVIRLAVVRRRRRAAVSAWLAPGTGGLTLRGSF